MFTLRHQVRRALLLARVAAGIVLAHDAASGALVLGAALAGTGVAVAAVVALAGEAGLAAAAAGTAASIAAAAAHIVLIGRIRRRRASEFAQLARRLGEEKTARSEMRAALRRIATAVEGLVPTLLAESDEHDPFPLSGPFAAPTPADRKAVQVADRLRRCARAAAFYGGTDLELKRLALAGPCAEVIEEYRQYAGPDREMIYMEDGGGEWLSAPLDRALFVLLLREILDNVLEHAGDWDRIVVTTEPVPGAILLRVRDNGRGMDEDLLRALRQQRPARRGDGLGLPIVRAVVEAHGGSIRIDSESGRGTSIDLKFPTHA